MGAFTFTVSQSKMAYAAFKQGTFIINKIVDYRTYGLGEYITNIATKWEETKKVLDYGISRKIAWTGMSMTKSDAVPDNTNIPPSIEINETVIRMMKKRASVLGLVLSTDYEFFDDDNSFIEATQTWTAVAKLMLDQYELMNELFIYQLVAISCEGGSLNLNKSPAQLLMFSACDVPMASGTSLTSKFNWLGMRAGYGTFYWDFLFKTPEEVALLTLPSLTFTKADIAASKLDNPDDPGVSTVYQFTIPSGKLAGTIKALGSDGEYYTTVYYTSDVAGYIFINIHVSAAPATMTITYMAMI